MLDEQEGTWAQYQKLVLKLLEQHDEKIESLSKQLAEAASNSGANSSVVKEKISSLREDVTMLLELVREGNSSKPSILTRIDRLDKNITTLNKDVSDLQSHNAEERLEKKDLLGFKRTVLVTIIGVLCTVAWNLIQYFLK